MRTLLLSLLFFLVLSNSSFAQNARVAGVVQDENGAAVVDARVSFFAQRRLLTETRSDERGEFTLDVVNIKDGIVKVAAPGFASAERRWNRDSATSLKFVLLPANLNENVTITATRMNTPVDETAASVTVIGRSELDNSPSMVIDDALRQVPGFQLFRRTSSRTSNPTAQGASLRGVGASGASRALVLFDGIPLNDPFGGWVYWSRVPRASIDRIEVVRGGASNLYGSTALGGVVQLFTPGNADVLQFETSFGNQNSGDGSLFVGKKIGDWRFAFAAEGYTTHGYIPVAESQRGSVDTEAGSRHSTFDLMIERRFGPTNRWFARGAVFGEARSNGTRLQINRTHLRQLSAGIDAGSSRSGFFTIRTYGIAEVFDQTFTAVSADRDVETLTRIQRVPAQVFAFSSHWSRAFEDGRHSVIGGFEARGVRGSSDEIALTQGRPTSLVSGGGREFTSAAFFEDVFRVNSKITLTGSVRVDRWRNYRGATSTRPLSTNVTTVNAFADRVETAFSPNIGVVYRVSSEFSVTGSVFRAFRQPTLNELYRSFRVGDTLTLANENLRAERLTGGEAGFRLAAKTVRINGTFFWTEIDNPVANTTLQVTPALITRQRQNLGRTRSTGFELDGEVSFTKNFNASGGYIFADARVMEFPPNASLVGLMLPQVPRHQFTFQLNYANPKVLNVTLQGRGSSSQFDDDQNQFRLRPFATFDLRLSRIVTRGLQAFLAVENVLNNRYDVGRTPVLTLSSPTVVRGGIRFRFEK